MDTPPPFSTLEPLPVQSRPAPALVAPSGAAVLRRYEILERQTRRQIERLRASGVGAHSPSTFSKITKPMQTLFLNSLLALLPRLLSLITPKIKSAIRGLLNDAKAMARKTSTPADDLLVDVLKIVIVGGDPEDLFAGFDGDWVGLFRGASSELRDLLSAGVLELQKLADSTPNAYDDLAASLLKSALGVQKNPEDEGESSD